jgi:hypothetical protein
MRKRVSHRLLTTVIRIAVSTVHSDQSGPCVVVVAHRSRHHQHVSGQIHWSPIAPPDRRGWCIAIVP